MRTIHKFEVPATPGIHEIEVRGFQRWLDAGAQDGRLVIWAEVLLVHHIYLPKWVAK